MALATTQCFVINMPSSGTTPGVRTPKKAPYGSKPQAVEVLVQKLVLGRLYDLSDGNPAKSNNQPIVAAI